MRVYVAGPISTGDMFENVQRGIRAGKALLEAGLAPYVPHFDAYMFPHGTTWNGFLEWDMEWLAKCEALYRLAGPSAGADREVEMANDLGIPVYMQLTEQLEGQKDPGYRALMTFALNAGLTGMRR